MVLARMGVSEYYLKIIGHPGQNNKIEVLNPNLKTLLKGICAFEMIVQIYEN